MPKPLTLNFLTAAGSIPYQMTEEAIEKLPAYRAVTEPSEGRPKLAAALYLWAQEQLDEADSWYWITDTNGHTTMLRTSAIFGVRVDEPLEPGRYPGDSPIGFGRRP